MSSQNLQGGKTRKNYKTGGKWSLKYKKSINCDKPKGFSQKQYCRSKNRKSRKEKGKEKGKE